MRIALFVLLIIVSPSVADPCVSGLQPGQKPGPYSFLVATGPQRGQQTCYVCETADKPAIVIFARKLTDPLGRLMSKCDAFMETRPKDTVRSWATVLGEKTASLDELAKWSKGAGVKNVPIGAFDDPVGPPAFKLNNDAEITVLIWVNRKVVANFAYRAGELDDEAVKKIVEAMPKLVENHGKIAPK
jgi:hypothetical protein